MSSPPLPSITLWTNVGTWFSIFTCQTHRQIENRKGLTSPLSVPALVSLYLAGPVQKQQAKSFGQPPNTASCLHSSVWDLELTILCRCVVLKKVSWLSLPINLREGEKTMTEKIQNMEFYFSMAIAKCTSHPPTTDTSWCYLKAPGRTVTCTSVLIKVILQIL